MLLVLQVCDVGQTNTSDRQWPTILSLQYLFHVELSHVGFICGAFFIIVIVIIIIATVFFKFVCTIFLLTFINRLFLISHNINFQILVSKWEFLQSQSEIAKLISHLLSVASKILRTEDLSIIESQLSAENPFGNDRIVASFQVHETLLYLRAFIEALNITSVSVRSVPVIRLSKRRIHPAATLNEQDCFAIGGSSESKSAAYCMPVGS